MTPEARRARILAAAAGEFAERGYDSASLRSIATAAGVTTPVVYDHFGSKADLYRDVLVEQSQSLLEDWDEDATRPAAEVFRLTIDSVFGWIEENPNGWRILFADRPANPDVAETFRAVQDGATAALTRIFARLPELDVPASLERGQAEAAYAEAARNAVSGLAEWWWRNQDVPRDAVVSLATDVLWRGLGSVTS